jgi:ribose transport system permease protein
MKKLKKLLKTEVATVILATFGISLFLSLNAEGFTTSYNINVLLKSSSILILIGCSQLCALSIGYFNLALGSMGGFVAIFVAIITQVYGVSPWLAIILGLIVGLLLGAFEGILMVKTGINPFIITLSLISIILGISTVITKGKIYYNQPQIFKAINRANFFGVPLLFGISIICVFLLFIIMYKTKLGRKLLAVGANSQAAYFAGIKNNKIILLAFLMSGGIAGVAGILTLCRLGSAQLSIGSDWIMISFAVAVLGGTILSGGKVSVIGIIFGGILIALVRNGLILLDISYFWFQAFLGIILIIAFGINRVRYLATFKSWQ